MKGIKTAIKFIIGLALIIIGGYSIYLWRDSVLVLIKGCLGAFLILVGLVFLAIAKE